MLHTRRVPIFQFLAGMPMKQRRPNGLQFQHGEDTEFSFPHRSPINRNSEYGVSFRGKDGQGLLKALRFYKDIIRVVSGDRKDADPMGSKDTGQF